MPTAEADICNQALVMCGSRVYIDDLNTSRLEEAETCKVVYAGTRDSLIAGFPWPWATLRKQLTAISEATEPKRAGWQYIYGLPTDCLEPRALWPANQPSVLKDLYGGYSATTALRLLMEANRFPYWIEKATVDDSKVLLSDLAGPLLFYTAKVTDPTVMDRTFLDALIAAVAVEICFPLTGKLTLKQDLAKAARSALTTAQAAALGQEQRDDQPLPPAIQARL